MPKDIPQRLQKRLLRLISAKADLIYAQKAYWQFKAVQDEEFPYTAFLAMVTSYGRPFTENSGLGSLKCEFQRYPDFDDEQMNLRHSRMMDLRNKFLSHSSLEGTIVVVMSPGAIDPERGTKVDDCSWNIAKREFTREEFVDWLYELVEALMNRIDSATRDAVHEICSAYLDQSELRYLDTPADKFDWTNP